MRVDAVRVSRANGVQVDEDWHVWLLEANAEPDFMQVPLLPLLMSRRLLLRLTHPTFQGHGLMSKAKCHDTASFRHIPPLRAVSVLAH